MSNKLEPPDDMLSLEDFWIRFKEVENRVWYEFIDEVESTGIDSQGLTVELNSTNGTYQVDVSASNLQVQDVNLEDIDVSIDITVSGVNGLDTGSEASDTWYSIWVIFNPGTLTKAGLLSASTDNPTMPGGYTIKRHVGWVRNNSSSNFEGPPCNLAHKTHCRSGNPSSWDFTETELSVSDSWTNESISSFVPPGTRRAWFRVRIEGSSAGLYFAVKGNNDTNSQLIDTLMIQNSSVANETTLSSFIGPSGNLTYYTSSGVSSIDLSVVAYETQ